MNNGHVPAGRAVPGAPLPGVEMGGLGSGPGGGGGGGGGGPRRTGGRPPSYPPHYHQQHPQHQQQHVNPHMYAGYVNPYNHPYYHTMPPHFPQNGGLPNGYVPYQQGYARSPPSMAQHYVPIMGGGLPPQQLQQQQQQQQQQYSRPAQQSPIVVSTPHHPPAHRQSPIVVSTPHHAPLPPAPPRVEPAPSAAPVAPRPPPTPSSTHSSHAAPTPLSPASSHPKEAIAPQVHNPTPGPLLAPGESKPAPAMEPFRPPLPWLSHPNEAFPTRNAKSRRRKRILGGREHVELPLNPLKAGAADASDAPIRKDTPATSSAPAVVPADVAGSPSGPAHPSEPVSSAVVASPDPAEPTVAPNAATPPRPTPPKPHPRATVPALPIIPAVPKVAGKAARPSTADRGLSPETSTAAQSTQSDDKTASSATLGRAPSPEEGKAEAKPTVLPAQTGPKSWANLFSKPSPTPTAPTTGAAAPEETATTEAQSAAGNNGTGGFAKLNSSSMAEALRAYRVGNADKVSFIEPRGLINTGNMCYMNSVLQVLVFCTPFYDFLDQASKKAAHSFKSETPLIDAMIMFMREFKVIDSATNVDQLKRRLKTEELEQYGEPFTPEFVYDAIKQLSRFSNMKRGHQQDAEEFLGFLLECLNEECAHIIRAAPDSGASAAPGSSLPTPAPSISSDTPESGGWLEVGPRQRSAVTRSSGHASTSSPVNRIFGGQLRSELKIPGLKPSVTLQTYQSLQLDIDSPQVRNIVDALKGITKPETLQGNFDSPHGKDVPASKQVFIESLPSVLILHLKRFQFEGGDSFGTIKIWKKVGYPLELEIPREVLSRGRRNAVVAEGAGLPKYRLTAVVYHHGKHASGGHYTVDVLRQDGREWIRLDDTVIRRVRSEDVAEGGAEEDASKLGDASKKESVANRFAGMGEEDAGEGEDGWKQVSAPAGAGAGGKKWSSVVNGGTAPTTPAAKQVKENVKDNKVAYLLFYQRI